MGERHLGKYESELHDVYQSANITMSIHMMNPHALRVGDVLYWRHQYLRDKHGDTVTVTGIQRVKNGYSGNTMVRLQTETGTELKWYLSTVRAKLTKLP